MKENEKRRLLQLLVQCNVFKQWTLQVDKPLEERYILQRRVRTEGVLRTEDKVWLNIPENETYDWNLRDWEYRLVPPTQKHTTTMYYYKDIKSGYIWGQNNFISHQECYQYLGAYLFTYDG
jgi:hypothetical protein